MKPRESDLKPNQWYSAYHKRSQQTVMIRYLGGADDDHCFQDREGNVYRMSDFYFWKSTE